MLLDSFMPRWDLADRHEIVVHASPEQAYRAIREVDLARSWVTRLLLSIRNPLSTLRRGRPPRLTFDEIIRSGFILLAEESGNAIVFGLAGRFWAPSGGRVKTLASEFPGPARPGAASAVMAFWVEPLGAKGCRVVTETRVLCADAAALRSFRRYCRFVKPGSEIIRRMALRGIKRDAENGASRVR